MKDINSNSEALKRNFLDLTELRHILSKTHNFFEEVNITRTPAAAADLFWYCVIWHLSCCHALCVSATLLSTAKVMCCIQCCLVCYDAVCMHDVGNCNMRSGAAASRTNFTVNGGWSLFVLLLQMLMLCSGGQLSATL